MLGTFMQRIVEISDLAYQVLGENSSCVESYKVFYSHNKRPADKRKKWLYTSLRFVVHVTSATSKSFIN